METKFDVFDMFKDIQVLMKNQTKNKIKVIKCDKGGEYNFKKFNVFCNENNIAKQSIILYILEQIGIGKRKKN
jgi:hypothetical protein